MCRNSHDCTCAITCENIIRDPDGDFFPVDRIYGIGAGEDTCLFLVQFRAFQIGFGCTGFLVRFFLLRCGDFIHKGMFRGQNTIGCAKQCVTAGGEYCELPVMTINSKDHIGTI